MVRGEIQGLLPLRMPFDGGWISPLSAKTREKLHFRPRKLLPQTPYDPHAYVRVIHRKAENQLPG